MKLNEKHYERLKDALSVAYREKEKAAIGDSWQKKAMRRIRGLGPQDSKAVYWMGFEKLVWRFAPAACVLILIFSVCLLSMDFVQDYEIVKLFVVDPIEYAFVRSFGI